ncbi:MAG: DNA polymerase III subunit delta [Candidatus Brocadiia bacterium]
MARRRRKDETTFQDLLAHLRAEAPLPLYTIVGDEPFAQAQSLQALRTHVLGDADPELALSRYTADDIAEPAALFDELRTPPFLAPRRLVIVEDAAAPLARWADAFVAYLAKPSSTATLALTVAKMPKSTKLAKALRKTGMVVVCRAPRDYQLPRWIAGRAGAHDKRIDRDAAQRLADYIGVNLPVIDQTLRKLALYTADRPTITADDVEALVEDLPVTTIFRLTDAVGSKRPAEAIRLLDNLLALNNQPGYILSMIRWAMERLIVARTLLDRGATPQAIAKALRVRPGYILDRTLEQARRRPTAELHRGFALLLEADLETKTSAKAPRDTLEHLLLRLCA